MSSNLVIVAIPARDEKVWKVSSEKVPHLTLLFLGENAEDVDKLGRIVDFVEHATVSSEFGPFMLDVDERGTLGADDADVLFFRKDYSIRRIAELRNKLLQQNDIRNAYDSVDQYPEWQPHLTLGYPETPANEDEMPEHGLNWISFDRIAVWTGDFEGPEFKLRWPERELETALSMSMANDEKKALGIDAVMEHFGIKGMRWGVSKANRQMDNFGKSRKEAEALSKSGNEKAAEKVKLKGNKEYIAVSTKIMKQTMNSSKKELDALHKKPEFQFINSRDANGKPKFDREKFRKLENAEAEIWTKHLNKNVDKYSFDVDTSGGTWRLTPRAVEHVQPGVILVRPIRDENGFLIDVEPVEDSMEQAVERGAEFIEHFGVKGMKWGVRKDRVTGGIKGGFKKVGRGIGRALEGLGEHFYETSIYSDINQEAIHNKVADDIDQKLYRLQTAPKYRGKNLKTDLALKTEYDQDVAKVTEVAYRRAVKDVIGENARGTKEARFVDDARGARLEIRDKKSGELLREDKLKSAEEIQAINADKLDESLAQAATQPGKMPDITIPLKLDANDQIKAIGRVTPKVIHTIELGAEFIEHFGIKGMKWGVRKDAVLSKRYEKRVAKEAARQEKRPAKDVQALATIGRSKYSLARVDTKGGRDHAPTDDAIKVAVARQKLKKSGVEALSNTELQEVAKRLQLEVQVQTLESKTGRKSLGQQFIESLVNDKNNQKKAAA